MSAAERFGKFSLVGLLGAGLQLLLFHFLTKRVQLPALLATPIAVEITVLHNFAWHERFTWRDRGHTSFRRLCHFHASNALISLVGNTALTYCFTEWLRAPALLSAIAAIAVCAPANFLLADRWVYLGTVGPLPDGRGSVWHNFRATTIRERSGRSALELIILDGEFLNISGERTE